MNIWALAALTFAIAAVYLPTAREALHFGAAPLSELAMDAGLAAVIVSMAELLKMAAIRWPWLDRRASP
jgi:hypothetical protein